MGDTSSAKSYSGGQQKLTDNEVVLEGNSELDELMLEYINFPTRTVYWEYRSKFIRLVQKLLGSGTNNYFMVQQGNHLVTDLELDFLADTLRYVHTGKRKFSILAWLDLLGSDNGDTTNPSKRSLIVDTYKDLGFNYPRSVSVNETIQNWLAQDKGFDDMVFTINQLFGTKTKTLK